MDPFKPFHSQSERERPCRAVLTFESVDEILWCYHSNETSSAILSHGTIYLVCSSNFWVYGSNPMVLPFKWKLFCSNFTWYYWLFRSCFYKNIHGNFVDFYFGHFWEWKVKAPYSETLNERMTLENQSMFSTHSAILHSLVSAKALIEIG